MISPASPSVSSMAYVVHIVNGCVMQVRLAYVIPICVMFASSTSGTALSTSAGAITDHSGPTKDIDRILSFRSLKRPGHRKQVLISWNGAE